MPGISSDTLYHQQPGISNGVLKVQLYLVLKRRHIGLLHLQWSIESCACTAWTGRV